jgi:hypothetical protein
MSAKRVLAFLGSVLLLALTAGPARANFLADATATVDCSGYSLTVDAIDLAPSVSYEIDYSFTLTPASGPVIPVSGKINFVAGSSTATEGATGAWPGSPLTVPYTVTGSATLTSSGSTVPITFNGADSIVLDCGGTGCPATIGFWKNQKKHPFPVAVQASGLTIGGVTYTAAQLLTILKNPSTGNAVAILGRQLVGALINLAAGAQHNATADAAISDAETLLQNNSLNLLTSFVSPSSTLGGELTTDGTTLDGYNSSDFNTCSEGSGLNF